MTIASVCPVHGVQQSRMITFGGGNIHNVTFTSNQESCPEPGCTQMMRMMDGTFNFSPGRVEVVSAPQWSVDALEEVTRRVGQTIRILADPSASDEEAASATRAAEPDIETVIELLPEGMQSAVRDAVRRARSRKGQAGRKLLGAALATSIFLLNDYTGVRDNVVAMIEDAHLVVQWASQHRSLLPEWFTDDIVSWLSAGEVAGTDKTAPTP